VKKLLLIIMLFLLPLQYTWAMVASYDLHDAQDTEVHFGHHEHPADENHIDHIDLSGDEETNKQAANCHVHLGFSHLSCSELIGYALPVFDQQAVHLSTPYLFTYHSSPSYQPERPNWALLV
jgi:hypothetical protein